jgi:predicted kinase
MQTIISHKPLFLAIGGRVGTGKTTLAYALKNTIPDLFQAEVLDGDVVRRELLGYDLRHIMQDADYTPEVTARVVTEIQRRAGAFLQRGTSVIEPSGFCAPEDRVNVEGFAKQCDAHFMALWLAAPDEVVLERINKRLAEREQLPTLCKEQGHASDACPAVLDKFAHLLPPEAGDPVWRTVQAQGDKATVLTQVQKLLMQE